MPQPLVFRALLGLLVTLCIPASLASFVMAGMKGTQITERKVSSLGTGTAVGITVSDARIDNGDLNPGEKSDGVLCIRDFTKNPQLYRFVFPSDETRAVDAVVVL